MSARRQVIDRVPPRRQTEWDIRGALNFILGGAGAGLLTATAFAAPLPGDPRPLEALGLALVAGGLLAVFAKIGRPLRAMHVLRSASSWMTREAMIATVLFACGAVAILLDRSVAVFGCGVLGFVYIIAQAQILRANKGIPAWRRWSCVALMVVTALTEGFGILCVAALAWPSLRLFAWPLVGLIVLRLVVWRRYRADLRQTGAPIETLKVLDAFESRFIPVGHGAAVIAAAAGLLAGQPALVAVGGGIAALAGALLKYTLVCGAACKQGFALPHSPSRGRGRPGAGVKPGWLAGRRS